MNTFLDTSENAIIQMIPQRLFTAAHSYTGKNLKPINQF